MIEIDDVVPENPTVPNSRLLDYKKFMALSDENFEEIYLKLMEEYRDEHRWWQEGGIIPQCIECNKEISSPEELRRYHGNSLHPDCFGKYLEKDGKYENESDSMKQFLGRVSKLIIK